MGKKISLGRLQNLINGGFSAEPGDRATRFPPADNKYDWGSANNRWRNIYTGDLHLENDRGSYTLIEEEDYLSIRNNKTGKLYKFLVEEIPQSGGDE